MLTHLFFESYRDHRYLHSFPTRRSSDLVDELQPSQVDHDRRGRVLDGDLLEGVVEAGDDAEGPLPRQFQPRGALPQLGRESTRLHSSHANISYAVLCLIKKNDLAPHVSS